MLVIFLFTHESLYYSLEYFVTAQSHTKFDMKTTTIPDARMWINIW